MSTDKRKVNKLTLWTILGHGLGVLLIVIGILLILTSSFAAGLLTVFAGLAVFPPFWKFVSGKYKFDISGSVKIILLLVFLGMAGLTGPSTSDTSVSKNENGETAQEQKKVVDFDDSKPFFEDGVHEVGKDIEAGTYRTRKESSSCYFARLSGFGGTLDEILANENTSAPTVVTINNTDKGFKSTRCGIWTQDLSQITSNKTSFGDGIFIVNTDIEPGTYKSSGQTSCYYSRLSGFTGSLNDIISNENTDSVAIVTIGTTDIGFKSNRCGTWNKVQ